MRGRLSRTMLVGICPEVVDLFKDKSVNHSTFAVLRKMRPLRQIGAAELMDTAGNYSSSYARAILACAFQPSCRWTSVTVASPQSSRMRIPAIVISPSTPS